MEVTLILAKVFGAYFLLVTALLILSKQRLLKLINELNPEDTAFFVAGIFTVFLGLFLVVLHNKWGVNWYVVITILAWMTLFKGIGWLLFPNQMHRFAKKVYNSNSYNVAVLIVLLLGCFLSYHGFIA